MTLASWNPFDDHVQSGLPDGRFLNAAYTMIAAGPPRLSNIPGGAAGFGAALAGGAGADQLAYPIGLSQNWSLSQSTQWTQLFEIGSRRSYFIEGRCVSQAQLGRAMFHGPSLLRSLYAYYQDLIPATIIPALFPNVGAATVANPHDVRIPPGYDNLYLNLASDLFSQPVGLLLMMRDSNDDTYGAGYLENAVVPQYSLGTDAMGTVIQESVAIQLERVVPVATMQVGLITG